MALSGEELNGSNRSKRLNEEGASDKTARGRARYNLETTLDGYNEGEMTRMRA